MNSATPCQRLGYNSRCRCLPRPSHNLAVRYVHQLSSHNNCLTDLKTRQTPLAIGAFATTLTTLSLSLMEWRGVTVTNVFIGNFFFTAGMDSIRNNGSSDFLTVELRNRHAHIRSMGVGSWQDLRVHGSLCIRSLLCRFWCYYHPFLGVKEAYGEDTVQYNNALGFWILSEYIAVNYKIHRTDKISMGGLEFLFLDRIPAYVSYLNRARGKLGLSEYQQSGLYWDLFHCGISFRIGCCILPGSCRWPCTAVHWTEEGRWCLCVHRRLARILYHRKPDVPRGLVFLLSYGRYKPLFSAAGCKSRYGLKVKRVWMRLAKIILRYF